MSVVEDVNGRLLRALLEMLPENFWEVSQMAPSIGPAASEDSSSASAAPACAPKQAKRKELAGDASSSAKRIRLECSETKAIRAFFAPDLDRDMSKPPHIAATPQEELAIPSRERDIKRYEDALCCAQYLITEGNIERNEIKTTVLSTITKFLEELKSPRLSAPAFMRDYEPLLRYARMLVSDWQDTAQIYENSSREEVLDDVRRCCWSLKYAGVFRADREIVFAAIKQDLEALNFASDELKADKEFVLAALPYGLPLEYASDELKADPVIVLAAVREDVSNLECASAGLRADRDFMLEAVKLSGEYALAYALDELKNDVDLKQAAIKSPALTMSNLQWHNLRPEGASPLSLSVIERWQRSVEHAWVLPTRMSEGLRLSDNEG